MDFPIIKQGTVTGKLDDLTYFGNEGFQTAGTWQVAEEALRGGADVQLQNGSAVISYGGNEFPVTLTILEYIKEPMDEEADEGAEAEPVCEFDIKPEDGNVERLAALLGLLEHYSKKQLRAVIG